MDSRMSLMNTEVTSEILVNCEPWRRQDRTSAFGAAAAHPAMSVRTTARYIMLRRAMLENPQSGKC